MMHRAALSIFCLLSLGLISVHAAPPVRSGKKPPGSYCKETETALFDCEMSGANTVASICQIDRQVVFRLGGWWGGTPDLEAVSNGHDGRARSYVGRMGGNPNGIGASAKQFTMRFIWHGVDFYSYVTHGGRKGVDSGMAIEKDDVPLVALTCKTTRHPEFLLPNFVDEEKDERHRGLY